MNKPNFISGAISVLFGTLFTAIGFINTFWGNDPFYGLFVIGLSLVYYPPAAGYLVNRTGFQVKAWMKLVIGFFIVWSAVGVGELFDKIDLMLTSFK